MKEKIKKAILENSESKVFGCIHCQEVNELCINDLSLMTDEINSLIKGSENKTFKDAVEPLMKWLCENKHPHTTVIVTGTCSELVEGLESHLTNEFIID